MSALYRFYCNSIIICFLNFVFLDLEVIPIGYPFYRRPYNAHDVSQLSLYTFVFVSGTIGNAIVIRSFIGASDQPGSRFVVALATIDFLASVYVPFCNVMTIISDGHWFLGEVGCFILRPWLESSFSASAWILVAISLERAR